MIIDIIIAAFLVLYLFVGLKKGFMKMVISLLGAIVTMIAVIFLAEPFARFLSSFIPFDSWITAPIQGWVEGLGDFTTITVPSTAEEMTAILTDQMGIPGFISSIIGPWLFGAIPSSAAGITAAGAVASSISWIIVLAISGLLLFILIRIAVFLLQKLFKKLTQIKFIGAVDRVFGMVLGVAKGYLIVLIALTLITAMSALSFMQPVNNQISESTITKWLYEHNFISNWIFGKTTAATEEDETTDGSDNSNDETAENKNECKLIQSVNQGRIIYIANEQYKLNF